MNDPNSPEFAPDPRKTDPKAYLDWFMEHMPADWYTQLLVEAEKRRARLWYHDQLAYLQRLHVKIAAPFAIPMEIFDADHQPEISSQNPTDSDTQDA